jgi:hypothetical protein
VGVLQTFRPLGFAVQDNGIPPNFLSPQTRLTLSSADLTSAVEGWNSTRNVLPHWAVAISSCRRLRTRGDGDRMCQSSQSTVPPTSLLNSEGKKKARDLDHDTRTASGWLRLALDLFRVIFKQLGPSLGD